jgi:xanthine dehydrogenase accessory factor
MAMTPDGQIAGSVSAGCVEGAVYDAAMQTLETGRPQLLRYGVSNETAWDLGLACGGQIAIFVEPLAPGAFELISGGATSQGVVVLTVVDGPGEAIGRKLVCSDDEILSTSLPVNLAAPARAAAASALRRGQPTLVSLTPGATLQAFVDVLLPPPCLIMVGGVHIAVALTHLAAVLDFETVVIDPRRAFGSRQRFPHADRLLQAWPDRALAELPLTPSSAVAVLSHDPKIDDPALLRALPSSAFYVGALGSSQTQLARRERLLAAGLAPAVVERLRGPIGLNIGAQTPEEIALAIMAEVVAAARGH